MPGAMYPTIVSSDGPLENLPAVVAGLGHSLKGFDITKGDGKAPFFCGVAASYGDLTGAAGRLPDNQLIAVGAVVRLFPKVSSKSFDEVIPSFMNNPLLEPEYENDDIRAEIFEKTGGCSAMTKDGKPTVALKKGVSDWFKKFIDNELVLKDLNFDTDIIAEVLSTAPSKIDKKTVKFDGSHVYFKRKLVYIGVVRFPDPERPDFFTYSMQIDVSTDCFRPNEVVFTEKSSLIGNFHWKAFKPRVSMIESLSEETRNKAKMEGKKFYGDK